MDFHANFVSVSAAGDFYQISFAEYDDDAEQDGAYLLIQRQFEDPDEDDVYVETHDNEFIGHFFIQRIEFNSSGLLVEIDRLKNNRINVTFDLTPEEFNNTMPILKIISGEEDPFDE